jgi:hypothetical protein
VWAVIALLTLSALPAYPTPLTADFVRAEDGVLTLGGVRLRLVGVNSFGLLSGYLGVGQVSGPSSFEKVADAAAVRAGVYRFWTDIDGNFWFDKAYAVWSAESAHRAYLEGMARLIDDLRSRGIYALPTLVSNPERWSSLAGDTNFWTVGSEANLAWKEWVQSIVTRFKDDPAIIAWELANEANWLTSAGAGCQGGCASFGQLIAWARDSYDYVKSLDPNHLVVGGWSLVVDATGEVDLERFKQLNSFLDIASLHVFDDQVRAFPSSNSSVTLQATRNLVSRHVIASREIGKPFMIGEFGANLRADPDNPFLGYVLSAMGEYDGDIAIQWSWEEGTDDFRLDASNTHQVSLLASWSTALELEALRFGLVRLLQRANNLTNELAAAQADFSRIAGVMAELQTVATQLELLTRTLETRIDLLQAETVNSGARLDALESATAGTQGKIDELQRELDLVRDTLASVDLEVMQTNSFVQGLFGLLIAVAVSTSTLLGLALYTSLKKR